jgi:hypothetical protein
MNLGVSATNGVLGLSEVGFGSPILGHYPSAFGLANVISSVHCIGPVGSISGCSAGFLKNGSAIKSSYVSAARSAVPRQFHAGLH